MLLGYTASSVLFADGFNVFENIVKDPMVDVGNGLSNELNKRKEQRK